MPCGGGFPQGRLALGIKAIRILQKAKHLHSAFGPYLMFSSTRVHS